MCIPVANKPRGFSPLPRPRRESCMRTLIVSSADVSNHSVRTVAGDSLGKAGDTAGDEVRGGRNLGLVVRSHYREWLSAIGSGTRRRCPGEDSAFCMHPAPAEALLRIVQAACARPLSALGIFLAGNRANCSVRRRIFSQHHGKARTGYRCVCTRNVPHRGKDRWLLPESIVNVVRLRAGGPLRPHR